MEEYMRRAIELAKRGIGFVNPNPLVGAVIVKNGRIIGEGYHAKYGEKHAERNALASCGENPAGADMYVTLEPCCHYGKNPPCTEAVIEAGIKRVFVGSYDPNPLVAGKGLETLRSRGIEVVPDCLRQECDRLNDIFFHYITTKTPYVILKTAVSADGKISTILGDSKWVTNEQSRRHVHFTRKRVSVILTGINTVMADDPMLNCRCENPSDPVRIICDSSLKIPTDSRIARTAKEIPTYIATLSDCRERIEELEDMGLHIIRTEADEYSRVNLKDLMRILGEMQLDSVLIEGGSMINASALKSGIVNKLQLYIAPKLIGSDGRGAVGFLGIKRMSEAFMMKNPEVQSFGDDILIEYEVM